MKIKEAMEIGRECGCTTPEECIVFVETHAVSLFDMATMDKELSELYEDYNNGRC